MGEPDPPESTSTHRSQYEAHSEAVRSGIAHEEGVEAPSDPHLLRPRGEAVDDAKAPLVFHRGAHPPYAIRWFGVTSLLGHARHLVASAIASESIDSRDWMRPLAAEELLAEVARVLGADSNAPTLVEALGRPVWIDFVADTGDDHDVSVAVGRMLFGTYRVVDGERVRELPRGDLLIFGGDTAYPVATAEELHRRVVEPWNRILAHLPERAGRSSRASGGVRGLSPRHRVLLGIPGNHDWYDGLDGFARMFRRNAEPVTLAHLQPTSRSEIRAKLRSLMTRRSRSAPPEAADPAGDEAPPTHSLRRGRKRGLMARQLHLDEIGGIVHLATAGLRAVRAFWKGGTVGRRKRLVLRGYQPVQEASYWAIPLAPGLDMWGVDRQLGKLDFRQRSYFRARRDKTRHHAVLFIAPEPAVNFGERHEAGARMLAGCRLSLERHALLYLTGDTHHYERRRVGAKSMHVIAGGGGAFLHGTRIRALPDDARAAHGEAPVAYPSAAMSRRLVAQVPLKLAAGGAGFLVHICFGLLGLLELAASLRSMTMMYVAAACVSLVLTTGFYINAGHRRAHPRQVAAVAIPFGVGLGILPIGLKLAVPSLIPELAADSAVAIVYAFLAAFGFGLFLMTIAIVGLEHQQAFSVLGHPGFKHFVRLCVHPNGRVEAWTIGKDDPLGDGDPLVVDAFTWDGGSSAPAADPAEAGATRA